MNRHASQLGKLAKGHSKSYTEEEKQKRRERLIKARARKAELARIRLLETSRKPAIAALAPIPLGSNGKTEECTRCRRKTLTITSKGYHCTFCGHDWSV